MRALHSASTSTFRNVRFGELSVVCQSCVGRQSVEGSSSSHDTVDKFLGWNKDGMNGDFNLVIKIKVQYASSISTKPPFIITVDLV